MTPKFSIGQKVYSIGRGPWGDGQSLRVVEIRQYPSGPYLYRVLPWDATRMLYEDQLTDTGPEPVDTEDLAVLESKNENHGDGRGPGSGGTGGNGPGAPVPGPDGNSQGYTYSEGV